MLLGIFVGFFAISAQADTLGDISSVLREGFVEDILKFLKFGPIIGTVKELANALDALAGLQLSIPRAVLAGSTMKKRTLCIKLPPKTRGLQPQCIEISCAGNRPECLKKAVADVRHMLNPLINGLFLGYKKGDKEVKGLIPILLDMIQQSQAKKDLAVVTDALERVMNVLKTLEKAIGAASVKKQQEAVTKADVPEDHLAPEIPSAPAIEGEA